MGSIYALAGIIKQLKRIADSLDNDDELERLREALVRIANCYLSEELEGDAGQIIEAHDEIIEIARRALEEERG